MTILFPFRQNDEQYFRQFISGFVQIWEEQLNINFNDPPASETIKSDCGPHLSRLPEELLPAIGKFLIIAKDNVQNKVKNKIISSALLTRAIIQLNLPRVLLLVRN